MSKINLIPEVKQQKQRQQKINALATSVATITAVILGGLSIILLAYNGLLSTQIGSINNKISKTEDSLKAMKSLEEQVVNLEMGLKNIKLIVEKNRSWTKFFGEIEKATPGDIQFTSLSVNTNQVRATIKGKDIRSIERFIQSFNNFKNDKDQNVFSDVSVENYSKKESGEYVFEAKFNVIEDQAW
jgi:Tfp pilus assembly protein PilN